ncbi:MAG: hypothetical protein KDD11_20890 [Acidobacteria bacterium]|nr:hypothetical protein [Acidobacteriota bacterium]
MRSAEQLILLVGGNPLPNYLVARLLEPRVVFLVHSGETLEPARRLREVLNQRIPGAVVTLHGLADAAEAGEVHRIVRQLPASAHLDYTGGTKVMAAHGRLAFASRGGEPARASYLFEAPGDRACLRFDDGRSEALLRRELGLDLGVLMGLHGLRRQPGRQTAVSADEARAEAERFLAEPEAEAGQAGPGHWLEVWLADLLRQHLPDAEVSQGVHLERTGRNLELDVLVVRGHRLHLISCTTAKDLTKAKLKLFEASHRARQLGGDLSRAALACRVDGSDRQGRRIDQLRADVQDVWGGPREIEVFGLDDLREWHQTGTPSTSLLRWLDH